MRESLRQVKNSKNEIQVHRIFLENRIKGKSKMSAPNTIEEFIEKFIKITEMGWVRTHRSGPTGIGKTLEDLLGIEENNKNEPDFGEYELKAMRTNASSMLTLFTKTPQPPRVNKALLDTYGFATDNYENGEKVLHTTLFATRPSSLGNTGKTLKIKCASNRISIVDNLGNAPAYWDSAELEKAFNKKYRYHLVHVFADSSGAGNNEEFKFHTAWELSDFSFENMISLLREGQVAVDIRIGQYPDGRPHDHGTGFRIQERYLAKMFKNKKVLVEAD